MTTKADVMRDAQTALALWKERPKEVPPEVTMALLNFYILKRHEVAGAAHDTKFASELKKIFGVSYTLVENSIGKFRDAYGERDEARGETWL